MSDAPSAPPVVQRSSALSPRRFAACVALLLLSYLVLQSVYVLRLPLVMDEYQGAAAAYRLAEEAPYRDFTPYKTVLGYYVQLPVLLAAPDIWCGLMAVKLQMALLVAVTLGWAAFRLARRLRREAVLASLLLLVPMSTFLERSAELRVDMMTGLAGLISLVFLLEGSRRSDGWAGAWAALAFLVSQKGGFYALAGGAALVAAWLLHRDRRHLAAMASYAGAGLAVGGLYYLFWAWVAGVDPIVATAAPVATILGSDYEIRAVFWLQTLVRNPIFYAMAAVALVMVLRRGFRDQSQGDEREGALRLAVFALVLSGLCVWYSQPWPYFFVLWIPTLTVLHAEGADAVLAWPGIRERLVRPAGVAALAALVLLGVILPLATRLPRVLERDSAFQRYNVELADALLAEGETYVAGVEMLWDRRQGVRGLSWIDQRVQAGLRTAGPEELGALIEELEASPVKLVIWNYRLAGLPEPLRSHLLRRFRQVVGNLFLYSPAVSAGHGDVHLDFSGRYLVELLGQPGPLEVCRVDGEPVAAGQTLSLEAGSHARWCSIPLRLTLLPPEVEARFEPRFRQPRPLFPRIYNY